MWLRSKGDIRSLKVTNGKSRKPQRQRINAKAPSNRFKLRRAIVMSELLTRPCYFNEKKERSTRDRIRRLLRLSVKTIVNNYMRDNMKAPMHMPGKPALFTPSSFDIYFGEDIEIKDDGKTSVRTAHATGSGARTIALDPRHAFIAEVFPDLKKLMTEMTELCKSHCKDDKTMNCDFNHVSVKLYYNDKTTGEHTDIEFDKNHKPHKNNSQVPNTPVVIATFGDTKLLTFRKYRIDKDKNHHSTNRTLVFKQKSGSIIIMDPRDEYPAKGSHYYWKHGANLENGKEGVSVSLMFRVVRSQKEVFRDTGEYVDKTVFGSGVKEQQFDEAWRRIRENWTACTKEKKEVMAKIIDRLNHYWD